MVYYHERSPEMMSPRISCMMSTIPAAGKPVAVLALIFVLFLTLIATPLWAQGSPGDPAPAQSPPAKIVFLLLPLGLSGDFTPLTPKDVQKIINDDMEKRDPAIDVIIPDKGDSRLGGIDISGTIGMRDARKLAEAFGASFVCWGTMKFTYTSKVAQQGIVIEYLCTAQGYADVRVYDSGAQDIAVDQPMVQFKNGSTRAIEDSPRFNEVRRELLEGCVNDLSQNLRKAIRKRIESKDSTK
jgi:hypothetical protein